MSGHPLLTTNVYIGIAVVFLAMMVYWFFYNRSVRSRQTSLKETGHLPASEQEGIARGTAERNSPADANRKL